LCFIYVKWPYRIINLLYHLSNIYVYKIDKIFIVLFFNFDHDNNNVNNSKNSVWISLFDLLIKSRSIAVDFIIIIINYWVPRCCLLHSSTLDYSNSRFAKVFKIVLAARIIREMEKFGKKSFTPLFRGLCRWSALIFLSRRPSFTVPVLYLLVSTANRFSIWLSPQSFCILISEACDGREKSDF